MIVGAPAIAVRPAKARHAGEGEAALKDLTAAYSKTQPKAIFFSQEDGGGDGGGDGERDNNSNDE